MGRKDQKKKKCRSVALIHDLDSLRFGTGAAGACIKRRRRIGDNSLLRKFDVFICHNERMEQYLVQQGFDKEKLINMELFDYLSDCGCRCVRMEIHRLLCQATVADFIVKNKVGIVVDSLWGLEEKIRSVTEEECNVMCKI